MFTDKTLVCADCGQEFLFTASEQEFYSARQFSEPRRCASCRAARKAARGDSAGGGGGYGASSYGNGGGGATAAAAVVATAVAVAVATAAAPVAARVRCST